MPTIDVTDAAQRLLDNKTVTPGHCLMYVSRAIRNGVQPLDWDGLDTALDCWENGCGDKHDSRDVPKGFPAFLGSKRGSNAGDVIISLGDGTFAATDWPDWRQVGVCTLEQREKQTGRKYLGYAGEFLGYTLTTTATASLIATPITTTEEDTQMVTLISDTESTRWAVMYANGQHKRLASDAERRGYQKIIEVQKTTVVKLSGEEFDAVGL